jgi:hypothetical protein
MQRTSAWLLDLVSLRTNRSTSVSACGGGEASVVTSVTN